MDTHDDSVGRRKCDRCDIDLPVKSEYVRQWLTTATEDATEAIKGESKRHALFWVQQATEKMV